MIESNDYTLIAKLVTTARAQGDIFAQRNFPTNSWPAFPQVNTSCSFS